jgi:hypothetical protein
MQEHSQVHAFLGSLVECSPGSQGFPATSSFPSTEQDMPTHVRSSFSDLVRPGLTIHLCPGSLSSAMQSKFPLLICIKQEILSFRNRPIHACLQQVQFCVATCARKYSGLERPEALNFKLVSIRDVYSSFMHASTSLAICCSCYKDSVTSTGLDRSVRTGDSYER